MKVTVTQYAKTLFELTDGKSEQEISDVVKRFAEVLNNDGQLKNAGKIMEKFAEIYNAANGIVDAEVTTARKLEASQIAEIEKFVKEKYSAKQVEIKNVVDEKIRGGIIVRVGDEVIDGSVATQLKNLKKALSN